MNRSIKRQILKHRSTVAPLVLAVATLVAILSVFHTNRMAQAAGPWDTLLPFKKIDADQNSSYPIAQSNGPWMIMAYTFRGEKANEDAQKLVYELRSKYKLTAYSYERTFDFSKPERGLGVNPDGSPKMMRYQQGGVIKETAVLVGDFETVDDPTAQSLLKKIKKLEPASIHPDQSFASTEGDSGKTAPMRFAMVVTNPLLPKEYFSGKGVDKLVLEMNKDVPNCLLDCPGKYSIQVATFNGNTVVATANGTSAVATFNGKTSVDQKKIDEMQNGKPLRSQLTDAAEKAHEMTLALRNKGYEAYEFHDRDKSIVCVGSFDSVGVIRPDGTMQLDPVVQKIVEVFGDDQALREPGKEIKAKSIALEGFKVKVPFDVAPKPIEVPRRSFSADYQRSMHAKL